jgi:hypothetical protein
MYKFSTLILGTMVLQYLFLFPKSVLIITHYYIFHDLRNSATITGGHLRYVTSYAANLPIALRHTLISEIELTVYLACIVVLTRALW